MEPLILGGVDEAGLGPLLGPYSASMVLFEVNQEVHLFNRLHPFIQKQPHKDGLALADSKALFSQKSGLAELEKTVLAFYCLNHPFPANAEEWFRHLLAGNIPWNRDKAPWYGMLKGMTLPLDVEEEEVLHWSGKLKNFLDQREILLKDLSLVLSPALGFNELLHQWKNKARVCQQILNPLLEKAFLFPRLELTVDRQGGRRFYGDWMMELFPGQPLSAERETKSLSRYHSREKRVQFLVSADASHLETALASMTAKYGRELIMILFNQYWQKICPGIKKTAGYYTDGKRFLKELRCCTNLPDFWTLMERQK